jgi:hypothetical protein
MANVYIRFPRTGLGNMLLVWSRGFVFASINDLPLVTSPWGGIHWGAWMRWERKKRTYWGYFKENTRWERLQLAFQKRSFRIVNEPGIDLISPEENGKTLFLFDQVFTDNDLFGPVRAYRPLILQGLSALLLPAMKQRLEEYAPPRDLRSYQERGF